MQGTSRSGEGGKESAIVINYYVTPDGSELRLDLVLLIAGREKKTGEKILVVINGMASGGKRKKK